MAENEDIASQSTLVIFGLFCLASGRRLAVTRKNAQPTSSGSPRQTFFNFYTTSIQCPDRSSLPAELRVYSPRDDVTLDDGTIAIVLAKAHFPDTGNVLLDAIGVFPFPGDPTKDSYQDSAPDLIHPYIYGIGTVSARLDTQADGVSRGFQVKVRQHVRDQERKSTIVCVLPGNSRRWTNVPIPNVRTLVYFLGSCSHVRPDRVLALSLEHLLFNLSPPPPHVEEPVPESATGKRLKFTAFATSAMSSLAAAPTSASMVCTPSISSGMASSSQAGAVAGPSNIQSVQVASPSVNVGDPSSQTLDTSSTQVSRRSSTLTPPPMDENANDSQDPDSSTTRRSERSLGKRKVR